MFSAKKILFKRKETALLLSIAVLLFGMTMPANAVWKAKLRLTTSIAQWSDETALSIVAAGAATNYVTVDTATKYQTIDGFGGCFNELGWKALNTISAVQRDSIIRALFDTVTGCKFSICRMPIGASDYARDWYSLNENSGDYAMNQMSIARDSAYLLQYIKAAMQYRPDLKMWGSPWSPPQWMKDNASYNGGHIIWNPTNLGAYALYLEKAVDLYRKQGINFFALAYQNESTQWPSYPGCVWNQAQHRDFIKLYLGPKFATDDMNCEIWTPTLNCDDYTYFQSMLGDTVCAKYITTVCFQWTGKNVLTRVNQDYPKVKKYQTETECGDGTNTWNYGFDPTFRYMNFYLSNSTNGYMQWNMVLDQTGKSGWGWPQNAMITVDTTNKKIIYNTQYYIAKHFSYYVQPKAKKIKADGTYGIQDATTLYGGPDGQVAFQNPDGSIVVVLARTQNTAATVALKIGTQMVNVTLPAQSIGTAVIWDSTGNGVINPFWSTASSAKMAKLKIIRSGSSIIITPVGSTYDLQLFGVNGRVKASISSNNGTTGFQKINGVPSGVYVIKGMIDGKKYSSMVPVQ
jgi:glucosylceramidase